MSTAVVAKGVKNTFGPDTIFRIHPAFGIARVGNSTSEFFIGPEIAGQGATGAADGVGTAAPPFKDSSGKIKRQGARFRIWRYDWNERQGAYVPKDEVNADTPGIKTIKWTVELANRKASFFKFDGGNGEESPYNSRAAFNAAKRNPPARASAMEIGPFKDDISGKSTPAKKLQGGALPIKFLGEILTDAKGRLIVLGGKGDAQPTNAPAAPVPLDNPPVTNYANNHEWIDDISDGPVTVEIEKNDGSKISAEDIGEAWVAVGPPDFAPQIGSLVTLYDTLADVAVQHLPAFPSHHAIYKEYLPGRGLRRLSSLKADFSRTTGLNTYQASFQQEIEPLLARLKNYRFVFNPFSPGSMFTMHSTPGKWANAQSGTTATGGPPYTTGVKASVLWDNGFVYFLKGDQYIKYNPDPKVDRVEPGYPLVVNGNWAGLPTAPRDFTRDIDAIVTWNNGKAYVFKGNEYLRYNMKDDKVDAGYPRKIAEGWTTFPAAFQAGIDSAVLWNNGKAYFFKGDKYIRVTVATKNMDLGAGYPLPIKGNWPGFPQPASDDQPKSEREGICERLRTPPGMTRPAGLDASFATMPKLRGDEDLIAGNARQYLSLTGVQFALMIQWWKGTYESGSNIPPAALSPEGLDRAALENCVGGSFFPGIEVSWLVRNPKLYREPFRVDRWERTANGRIKKVGGVPVVKKIQYGHGPGKEDLEVKAGYFSQQMAVPWQSDFMVCFRMEDSADTTWGWWPAQRPDDVYKTRADSLSGNALKWDRGFATAEQLIGGLDTRGFVVQDGDAYLEKDGPP